MLQGIAFESFNLKNKMISNYLKSLFYTLFILVFDGLLTYLISKFIPATLSPTYTTVLFILGVILIFLGTSIRFWATIFFFKNKKHLIAISPTNQVLLQDGPYKFSRNPLYAGWFVMLFGYTFIFNSVSVLAFSIAFMICTHLYVVYIEEKSLEKKIGKSYNAYKQTVPRWW